MSLMRMLRRPSVRKYTIVLCVCYLLVVLVFHSRLQFRVAPIAQDADELVVHHTKDDSGEAKQKKALTESFKTQIPPKLNDEVEKGPQIQINSKPRLPPDHDALNTSNLTPEKIGNLFDGDHFQDCVGRRPGSEYDFQSPLQGVMLQSAYWDERPNDFDNRYEGVKIRIMGVIQGKGYRPTLQCKFDVRGKEQSSLITYYEMCENHNRRWGGFILSCEVPPEIQKRQLCSIEVTGSSSSGANHVRLPVYSTAHKENAKQYKYAMCVPPMFGNVTAARLIEFLEMSLMLGVQHVMLYNYSVSANIDKTLQYYKDQGVVTVIPWRLPTELDKGMWYHGQIVAVEDCLYRNMGRTYFLSFQDIDELIVPHKGTVWDDVIPQLDNERMCGFKFKSAFFNPRSALLPPLQPNIQQIPSLMIAINQRSAMMSQVRTKCMVKPSKIFEMGIHHISKPILASLGGVNVDAGVAVLHHYRPCLAGFGMKCRDQIQDDTALYYGPSLYTRVRNVLQRTKDAHRQHPNNSPAS